MKKYDLSANEFLGIGMITMLIVPMAIAWQLFWTGLAVHYMWSWFVLPIFGMAAPSILMCAGLAGFAGLLTKEYKPKSDNKLSLMEQLSYPVIRCAILLGVWWLVIKIAM